MNRIKTLSLPLFTALALSGTAHVDAQLSLELSSQKTYRQNKNAISFKGGSFGIQLQDGSVSSIEFCDDPNYLPPGNGCATSGFLSAGNINGATPQRPYLAITELKEAVAIEPSAAEAIQLIAAPASILPRPSGGFTDDSATVYYNLHTTDVREYKLTRYFLNRTYSKNQRSKFDQEIVVGSYRYSFPRLGNPNIPAPLTAVIFPMPEGLSTLNNKTSGFQFTRVNQNKWNEQGYVELNYHAPNILQWEGLNPSTVFAGVDRLYISLRGLRNPKNPDNSATVGSSAIFPAFNSGTDPRVSLPNPYAGRFTLPPIFPVGTSAVVELELDREFQTGGVTYDFSTRKFQIPVVVVSRYSDFAKTAFGSKKKKTGILADNDGDGFNNLTEWTLDSDPADGGNTPPLLEPANFQAVNVIGGPTRFRSYFGFNVPVKENTDPNVVYTLQRSFDQGKTWATFISDFQDWSVERVTTVIRGIVSTEIQVRSLVLNPDLDGTIPTIQPPGTLTDVYRVKVTLAE